MLRYLTGFIVMGGYAAGVWALAEPGSDCEAAANIDVEAVTQRMGSLPFKDQLEVINALQSVRMNSLLFGAEAIQPGSEIKQVSDEQMCKGLIEILSAKGLL